MSELSKDQLKKEIAKILEGTDLSEASTKKVIKELKKNHDEDFSEKKHLISKMIKDYVQKQEANSNNSDDQKVNEDSDKEDKESLKRSANPLKTTSKKAKVDSKDDESDEDLNKKIEKEIEDILKDADLSKTSSKQVRIQLESKFGISLSSKRKQIDAMVMNFVNKHQSSSEDEVLVAKKKNSTKKKGGYMKFCKLSPALAELMGDAELPKHEVVKRCWAMIKERKLQDPSNKQFVICDEGFRKVFGSKRFRAFGMLKHLRTHFLDD